MYQAAIASINKPHRPRVKSLSAQMSSQSVSITAHQHTKNAIQTGENAVEFELLPINMRDRLAYAFNAMTNTSLICLCWDNSLDVFFFNLGNTSERIRKSHIIRGSMILLLFDHIAHPNTCTRDVHHTASTASLRSRCGDCFPPNDDGVTIAWHLSDGRVSCRVSDSILLQSRVQMIH